LVVPRVRNRTLQRHGISSALLIQRSRQQFPNYDEWNAHSRKEAAKHIYSDTRPQPRAEEQLELEPQVQLVPRPGGLIIFSGAQLHSTVPNTSGKTRFSIDFRVVNIDDLTSGRGAPNVDSSCTGTTLRDYLRGTDLAHLPGDLVARYDTPRRSDSSS
jgi:ectoine hydroxylase-related dioxygenase (phytanoyl-CoA dioxygenase family)